MSRVLEVTVIDENNAAALILQNALESAGLNDSYIRDVPPSPGEDWDQRLKYLERSLASLQNVNHYNEAEIEKLNKQTITLERELSKFQQYNRRESIEISGIPDSVPQEDLEKTVVGLLQRLGVQGLTYYEVAACHRIKRKVGKERYYRVIIRFVCRKRGRESFVGRYYIRDTIWEYPDMWIHDSLCPKYKDLFDELTKLRTEGKIRKLWTHNGTIFFKKTDDYYERAKRITHTNDISRHFDNNHG